MAGGEIMAKKKPLRQHTTRTVYLRGRDRRHRDVYGVCLCGWHGPVRARLWEVHLDTRAHLEHWGVNPS